MLLSQQCTSPPMRRQRKRLWWWRMKRKGLWCMPRRVQLLGLLLLLLLHLLMLSRFNCNVRFSIVHVIKTVVHKEGYRGLMRGWMPRMLFHAPAAAICWSTYEASKAFFERLNVRPS